MKFNIQDYPIVFLDYDEPNADSNYKRILEVYEKTLRVSGIKGSDTAHKQVATIVGDAKRVTIIDGDNFVHSNLLNCQIELVDTVDLDNSVISFSALNPVNGNCYGNGGIKNWPVSLLKTMQTHENSTDKNSVDFDFTTYLQLNRHMSETHINASPLQAWRAGFREGVKLCMENGKIVNDLSEINWRNYDRLWRWMHLGLDLENGLWAIYGARMAVYLALVTKYDIANLRDFDNLNSMFNGANESYQHKILDEANRIGNLIKIKTNDHKIKNVLSPEESIDFKKIPCILRSTETFIKYKFHPPYDIVFISYDEPNADETFEKLKERFPKVKRVHGVKGIHNAHIAAAKLCATDYFWVVDGDNDVVENFEFEYEVNFYEEPKVRVWRCQNPINGLVYGYGGVKLLPRMQTIQMNTLSTDMTTSISKVYEPIFKISSITNFNTDPFHTWRSSFRECVKLSSQVIERQNDEETLSRLNTWCTVGLDKPFGKYAIDGAKQGREFGTKNKGNIEQLKLINDFNWLKSKFDETYNQ